MAQKIHHYSNGEITVTWKPGNCIHSGICFKGLAGVFDPRRRPWIDMSQATTQQIIDQVKKCPSAALSIESNTPVD
ncbi:MAG: (4Fe-4S)-binding protein [Chitinophagaceae bacterium]|nr:(4Fe-4S)-binding protein [Chitinophagaceae bacterium]